MSDQITAKKPRGNPNFYKGMPSLNPKGRTKGSINKFTKLSRELMSSKGPEIVDKVIVAISSNSEKKHLFNADERFEIVKNALFKDLKFNKSKILIITFNSLTTDLCKKYKSNIILRGLRAVSDFEY